MAQYTNIEHVHLRTTTGKVPDLPETVWTLPLNGPLGYVSVEWQEVSPKSLDSVGTVKVSGTLSGSGQKVSAWIHVLASLKSTVDSLDYAATVTTPGKAPVLPRTVVGWYRDGSASSTLSVKWKRPRKHDYAESDQLGDIEGSVSGIQQKATGTYFVIDPNEVTDAPPHVELEIAGSPNSAGWYTKTPTLTIEAKQRSAKIKKVEYSFDEGKTWKEYPGKAVKVTAQGEIIVMARAVDTKGRTGQAKSSMQVDTSTPKTTIKQEKDGNSVRFTLEAADGSDGSGVSRIVYSSGPSKDPGSSDNDMWATYSKPFSVTRRKTAVYVHVRAQDAAGNQEKTQTVKLDPLS